jgi:competence protein ComEC
MAKARLDSDTPIAPGENETGRTPLLWILVPACLGIYAASEWPLKHPVIACVFGILCATLALAATHRDDMARRFGNIAKRPSVLWATAVIGCAFALFWSYASARMLDRLEWKAALPPREVTMEMRVDAVYNTDKFGNHRGLARIVSAPEIQRYLIGQQATYRIQGDIAAREGATLRVKGIIARMPLEAEASSFDSWLKRSEVYFELRRAHIVEETAPPSRYMATTLTVRRWMREKLLEGSDKLPYIRAMVPAMLLGEKNLLSPDDKALFKETGMMHLFAVSGLHVGLVALTLEALLAALRVPRVPRIFAAQTVLLGYVCVIGAPPSAVRAFLMILCHRMASLGGRPSRGLPALAGSALAVILWDPRQLFDIGAQLSYGIVAAIMLYGMPLGNLMKRKLPLYDDLPAADYTFAHKGMLKSRDWLCDAVATTLAAFAVSVPLSMQYFGNFAPGSMLINLLMTPLALLSAVASVITIIFAGAALIPGLGFLAGAGIFFNYADWFCAWEMEGIIDAVGRVPLLFYKLTMPAPWLGGLATAAILALMVMLRHKQTSANIWWMLAPVATLVGVVVICAVAV